MTVPAATVAALLKRLTQSQPELLRVHEIAEETRSPEDAQVVERMITMGMAMSAYLVALTDPEESKRVDPTGIEEVKEYCNLVDDLCRDVLG